MAWYNTMFIPTRLSLEDIRNIRLSLQPDFQQIRARFVISEEKIDHLITTVDGVNALTQKHDQEWAVLRAQYKVMRKALIQKNIASESELSIQ